MRRRNCAFLLPSSGEPQFLECSFPVQSIRRVLLANGDGGRSRCCLWIIPTRLDASPGLRGRKARASARRAELYAAQPSAASACGVPSVFDPWPKFFESQSARFGAIERFLVQGGAFAQGHLYPLSLFGKSELEAATVDPAHQIHLQQESVIAQPSASPSGGQIVQGAR